MEEEVIRLKGDVFICEYHARYAIEVLGKV
jgi:hypothetical protein